MRLSVVLTICGLLCACAQRQLPEGDVYTLYDEQHILAASDLEKALQAFRNAVFGRYGAEVSFTRVRVVDRNHIRVGYWDGSAMYAEVERVTGLWIVTHYKKGLASRSQYSRQLVSTGLTRRSSEPPPVV